MWKSEELLQLLHFQLMNTVGVPVFAHTET